jgi:hypothetical protein
VLETGGVTLRDRGYMQRMIQGAVTSTTTIEVGSAQTVRGSGGDWNLLAIHELGANPKAAPGHALPVPLTDQARRTAPRDFPGLFMVKRANRAPILATSIMGGRGKGRGAIGITPQYILLQSVRIPARPTSPFDWKRQRLIPAADMFVRKIIPDYIVTGNLPGGATA